MQPTEAPLDESLRAVVEEELALAHRLDEALKALGAGAPLSRTAPYFGHLRVALQGRRRDLLVGEQTWLRPGEGGVPVLGWRSAPLARVFLLYGEGERFEEEVDDRVLEGRVLLRRQVGFEGGRLVWIAAGDRHLERVGETWREVDPARRTPALVGQAGGWSHPERREALDPDQKAVLARAPDGPALILGPAGSGKTTVALHRLRSDRGGRNARQLVVVPEPGLADMARSRLARLGLPRVPVRTFDDWVEGRVRAVLPGLAKKVAHDAPPAVMRLKRHPVVRRVLGEFVEAQAQALGRDLAEALGAPALAAALTSSSDRPVLDRLDDLERRFQREPGRTPLEVRRELGRARARLMDLGQDRIEFFGDRRWLERILELAGGQVWPGDADATQLRVRRQLDETTEQAFAGVEADRLQTLDGRGMDEDTPARLAGTVDVEDLPILLELLWLKAGEGPLGKARPYDHILVDEVQDTAPAELATLVRSVGRGGRLTASGDEAQHLDPTVPPTDWDVLGEVMGVGPDRRFRLHYSHRCPAPVLGFARGVLGLEGDGGLETRPGPPVEVTRVSSPGQAATLLIDVLGALMARAGHGEVAVICRDPQSAREIHDALSAAMDARLVLEGAFPFAPGLLVTEVQAVRGLEFDVVVVPDAGAARYPATDEAAAALHLASTRARHQLWVLSPGTPSPLLPPPSPDSSRASAAGDPNLVS